MNLCHVGINSKESGSQQEELRDEEVDGGVDDSHWREEQGKEGKDKRGRETCDGHVKFDVVLHRLQAVTGETGGSD